MKCILSLLLLASIVCLAQTYRVNKNVSAAIADAETPNNTGINRNSE